MNNYIEGTPDKQHRFFVVGIKVDYDRKVTYGENYNVAYPRRTFFKTKEDAMKYAKEIMMKSGNRARLSIAEVLTIIEPAENYVVTSLKKG